MFEWHWKGKVLRFTRHIRRELDRENKTIELVMEILENGEHRQCSKHGRKFEAHIARGNRIWVLS